MSQIDGLCVVAMAMGIPGTDGALVETVDSEFLVRQAPGGGSSPVRVRSERFFDSTGESRAASAERSFAAGAGIG